MFTKLRNLVDGHITKNRKEYLFLSMAFVAGVSAGAFTVNGLGPMQKDELDNYFHGFIQLFNNLNLQGAELFMMSLIENLKIVGLIWVLGVTIIGIPFIFIILAVKGFITGFSSGFLISGLGLKGILFTAFTVLPREIIITPCLIAIAVNGVNFSMHIVKNKPTLEGAKKTLKSSFLSYCFVTFFFSLVILAGIIADAYLTPILIRIISPVIT